VHDYFKEISKRLWLQDNEMAQIGDLRDKCLSIAGEIVKSIGKELEAET
jgi:hypothetical protein